jgi:hypothetical protein
MKEFWDGFISAAKKLLVVFSPLIAVWRLLCGVTDSVLNKTDHKIS